IWIALAFWTKYTVVVLGAPIALLLLIDPFARRTWRTPGPWLMAATFAVLVAPHLWWLVSHDFIPLHYADVRARLAVRWYEWIVFPLRWVGSQLLFQLPTLVLLGIALFGAPRVRPLDACMEETAGFARRYLAVMALGPFLLVTLGAALTG